MINNIQLILASSSEGRRKLLELLKIPFEIIPSEIDEDKIVGKTPLETIQLRARLKGEEVAQRLSSPQLPKSLKSFQQSSPYPLVPSPSLIISADSSAILNHEIIGKPKDYEEARKMLSKLSGHTHEFMTAIYIANISISNLSKNISQIWQDFDRSFVTFRKLSKIDINLYLKHIDYSKFAGAYALFSLPLCPAPPSYEDLISGKSYLSIINKIRNQYSDFVPLIPDFITKIEGSLSNVIGLPLEKVVPILKENKFL